MGRLGVQAFAFYSRLFKDLPSNIDVPGAGDRLLRFLLLFLNRLAVLVEQLARAHTGGSFSCGLFACRLRQQAGQVYRHLLL